MSVGGDVLESTALLVGVVGVVYGTWYSEISAAKKLPIPEFDQDPARAQIGSALWARVLPLAAVLDALVMALAYPVFRVVMDAIEAISSEAWTYDASGACFLIAFCVLIGLSLHANCDLMYLIKVWTNLNSES